MRRISFVLLCLSAACASAPKSPSIAAAPIQPERITEHRSDGDDLMTAGLGLDGLRQVTPPAFADPAHPTPEELRRRAIWSSWRGIVDFSANGGFGTVYGKITTVPGREFSAFALIPGASQPHRVLVQLPDTFDTSKRCVVVAPSSGSRGVYGAIGVAAPWGFAHGCAIAYTDKGAGSDFYDLDSHTGVKLDGTRGGAGDTLAFAPPEAQATHGVAVKHAHSHDNPEADWGRHTLEAVEFALVTLNKAFPDADAFTYANTRVIAVGVSNGGGAVLKAAQENGDWLDAVVAGEPNIAVGGSRPLFDYQSEGALMMPCALLHLEDLPTPPVREKVEAAWQARCASLAEAQIIEGATPEEQAANAYEALKSRGWTDAAMHAGALSVAFDLYRAVAVTYASAYNRSDVGQHPCGYDFSALDNGAPRAATEAERAAWFSDASGVPPSAGVMIVDSMTGGADPTFNGLMCLRRMFDAHGYPTFDASIAATEALPPREGLPVIVVHGTDDGLIPPAFTSDPYVAAARAAGRAVTYWQVEKGQHFDAFLALPSYGARFAPLLPYVYRALDNVWAHLDTQAPLASDARISSKGRGAGAVEASQLP